MKLLIVSWGDFERWKEIRYRFENETSVGPSTLPILQKVIKPDWTVIVLSDTLGKNFSSYEALREDVRSRVMDFLERIGAGREVDVLIVPGIGQFAHGTFKGNAMDAYYYLLHKFTDILPDSESIEVHFDSTHGLNYITLLAYRALKELLGIAAITNDVKFIAYNSDPFVPGISRELTINIIEKSSISPSPLDSPLPSGLKEYLGNFSLQGQEYGSILKHADLKQLTEQAGGINAWIASVINGLPLVFASYYPDVQSLEGFTKEIMKAYQENIKVSEKDRRVERALKLGKGFGNLIRLLYQVKVLKLDSFPKDELSVEELKEIAERTFSQRIKESTKTELHRLASTIKVDTNGWIQYSEILRMQDKNPNPQVDPRNFLAHAGLEANLIEIKRKGELYVRYRKDKVLYGGKEIDPDRVIRLILSKTLREE